MIKHKNLLLSLAMSALFVTPQAYATQYIHDVTFCEFGSRISVMQFGTILYPQTIRTFINIANGDREYGSSVLKTNPGDWFNMTSSQEIGDPGEVTAITTVLQFGGVLDYAHSEADTSNYAVGTCTTDQQWFFVGR